MKKLKYLFCMIGFIFLVSCGSDDNNSNDNSFIDNPSLINKTGELWRDDDSPNLGIIFEKDGIVIRAVENTDASWKKIEWSNASWSGNKFYFNGTEYEINISSNKMNISCPRCVGNWYHTKLTNQTISNEIEQAY